MTTDTIAAIATARGQGAIGVVKISGPLATIVAKTVTGRELTPRQAHYLDFQTANGRVIDQGLAIYFAGPDSYTGEDVLELQAHGNGFVLDQLLDTALSVGTRLARPGEFTERAFLNDKMDLAQAEAVADLIESNSREAARAAIDSLRGEFSKGVAFIRDQLIDARVYIEAALDFSEEEIDFLADRQLIDRLTHLNSSIKNLLARATEGRLMRDGITVVIVGAPNVGKSSLLNSLTGEDSAIVTDVPGTTRDLLRETIVIDGLPVRVVDTAGLRDTDDKVEQEGIRRARQQLATADHILAVREAGQDVDPLLLKGLPADVSVTWVFNKTDLLRGSGGGSGGGPGRDSSEKRVDDPTALYVSAKTLEGISELRALLKQVAGFTSTPEGAFMARRRHIDALQAVRQFGLSASTHVSGSGAGELAAEDLRMAQGQLNLITGEFGSDDLLGEIFGRFCIGK